MNAKFCNKCGERIIGEYKFCKKCGNPLLAATNGSGPSNPAPMAPNMPLDEETTVLQSQVPRGVGLSPDDQPTVVQSSAIDLGKRVADIPAANIGAMNQGAFNQRPMNQQSMNQGYANRPPVMQQAPQNSNNGGDGVKKIITVLLIILLLAVVGGVGYFAVNAIINSSQSTNNNKDDEMDNEGTEGEEEKEEAQPDKDNELYEDAVKSPEKHRYELVQGDITWTEAEKKAREAGGYLACVTTKEEEQDIVDYLRSQAGDMRVVFIGANNLSGEYKWVTGEAFNYTDWCPGEPNNTYNDENYVAIYLTDDLQWGWNDTPDDMYQKYDGMFTNKCGYLIEYNE